ncbi:MAG: ATP-binding protein [Bdellovibrionales bacterium]
MKSRYLSQALKKLSLDRHKMAFISGPRQVGKTTLSKSFKSSFDVFIYKNWDESDFRKLWVKSPNQIKNEFDLAKFNQTRLLVLDEIHKSKSWKQKLKGIYDELSDQIQILVTGSARLNVFKKGSDSLMGRYLHFRLHPFSLGELSETSPLLPEDWKKSLFKKPQQASNKSNLEILKRLMNFSGFPEPYFANSDNILRIWRRGRTEKIIREDLRDLSRLPELSQVEMLTSLLPSKVGSPLSVQSLREDLEVSHDTVKRWLQYLKELYYFFEVKPWTKSVTRTLKKEGKIYLYDWTELSEEGIKFENLVACHLMKACHFWTDTGEGDFDLFYLRNKEKQEIDFLIVKDKKPWLALECKLKDTSIDSKAVGKFIERLDCPYVQVVKTENIWFAKDSKLVASADFVLAKLP